MPKTLLRDLSASQIVGAIADAAERWSNADFPPRVRASAAIEARLGYATPVVEYALDRLFFSLRRELLEAAIVDELGSLEALDGPTQRLRRPAAFARGVDRVMIVSSDTTIGVALVPALYALCAKSNVIVKDRSDELVRAFFETLIEERPEFAAAAQARAWTGGADADESRLLGDANAVVVFGSDETIARIRMLLRPDARFVPFGHRISIGYVSPDLLAQTSDDDVCEGIARDFLLYDGEGCLSLHALFVSGVPAQAYAFADRLARASERIAVEFPASRIDATRAAAFSSYRNLSAFRAAGGRGTVFSVAEGTATIAFDPPRDQPPPLLPRVLPVYPVHGIDDVATFVREHRLPVQALGLADTGVPAALALAQTIGAVRITRLGEMQAPPLGGHHGGAPRIADFVRWIDRE